MFNAGRSYGQLPAPQAGLESRLGRGTGWDCAGVFGQATQPLGAVALLTRERRAGQAPKTGHVSVLMVRLGVG